jgi:hypothetical protein
MHCYLVLRHPPRLVCKDASLNKAANVTQAPPLAHANRRYRLHALVMRHFPKQTVPRS